MTVAGQPNLETANAPRRPQRQRSAVQRAPGKG